MRGVGMAVAVLAVLGMAQLSFVQSLKDTDSLIQQINQQDVSYVGLIMETASNEIPLISSGLYVPSYTTPTVTIKGRTFNIGTLNGVDIVYIKSEGGVLSTASTTQLLLDSFKIVGIVHYATAGSVNDTLFIGDVAVPSLVVDYGNIKWQKYNEKGILNIGDFNLPEPGNNSLGSYTFSPIKVFNASGVASNIFWIPIDSISSDIATKLQKVELQQCLSSNKCLPRKPEVVYGLRAGSADVYMTNPAAREFMYTQFKVSTVDTTTASIAWVGLVNKVSVVAFKGVSNTAGGSTAYSSYYTLGHINAFKMASAYIDAAFKTSSSLTKKNY